MCIRDRYESESWPALNKPYLRRWFVMNSRLIINIKETNNTFESLTAVNKFDKRIISKENKSI